MTRSGDEFMLVRSESVLSNFIQNSIVGPKCFWHGMHVLANYNNITQGVPHRRQEFISRPRGELEKNMHGRFCLPKLKASYAGLTTYSNYVIWHKSQYL